MSEFVTLARRIAHESSGSERHLLREIERHGFVIERSYQAPNFALATDERARLQQIHVRLPDGIRGYFSPGGPPRLWSYRFVEGSRPDRDRRRRSRRRR